MANCVFSIQGKRSTRSTGSRSALALFRQDVTSLPVIHSDAFLASPAFLFRSVFRPEAVRRRRGHGGQAHVQVLRDPTDEQEKHRRYLRGDRGGRADTYERRHFSWSRVRLVYDWSRDSVPSFAPNPLRVIELSEVQAIILFT